MQTLFLMIITMLWSGESYSGGKIEILEFESEVFNNRRTLRVYLPRDYDGQKLYKVLYVNDGQNVFYNEQLDNWRFDLILDSLISHHIIQPVIVVGIDNIGFANRGNEYLPWEDMYLSPPIPDPQGKKYPEFLTQEVMPFIESRYKVMTGSQNTGIGGFSYGGLISVYTLLMKPETFGFALIESPSLYVGNQKVLMMARNQGSSVSARIHIGIGTNELGLPNCTEENADNRMAVADVTKLEEILLERSSKAKVNVLIEDCARHSFQEASDRLAPALIFCLK